MGFFNAVEEESKLHEVVIYSAKFSGRPWLFVLLSPANVAKKIRQGIKDWLELAH